MRLSERIHLRSGGQLFGGRAGPSLFPDFLKDLYHRLFRGGGEQRHHHDGHQRAEEGRQQLIDVLKNIAVAVENLPARERNLILRYLGLEGTALNFRELAILLNYNGPSSAEKAYRRAVEKLKAALWEGEYGQYRRARRIVERAMKDAEKE